MFFVEISTSEMFFPIQRRSGFEVESIVSACRCGRILFLIDAIILRVIPQDPLNTGTSSLPYLRSYLSSRMPLSSASINSRPFQDDLKGALLDMDYQV